MKRLQTGDIAIVGMACTFPGARDLREYWSNICRKVDSVGEAPPEWESELFFDETSGANDRTYCKRGGFLGELGQFDPSDLGVMPGVVDGTEPDHFLALRTAAEALADAGYREQNKYKERTSVVIGRGTYVNRGNTTAVQHSVAVDGVLRALKQLHPEHTDAELAEIKKHLKASLPPFHADTAAGLVPNIISGRIANRLDLMGPNYIVDAACASSLVAVDLAIQDLLTGRSDLAVAGGVHASTTPVILIIFSHLKALSRAGQIRPFDADADGTLLGEGVGMVVLKRLADAERDGDRIYAVIKGVGSASDGRALGLLAPRLEGEVLALRRAYEAAGFDPSTVTLVEAHGTGTLVGDAVELEALTTVFGEAGNEPPRCALGTVKSMISHTMPAAGIAGIIKTALALHHKVLPPTLHCENPNPKVQWDKSRFYLNSDTRPWIHGAEHPRRAGVNAFGFGGINAHAVLEEYTGKNAAPSVQVEWDSELFVFSGADSAGLMQHMEAVQALLADAGGDFQLRNLAWTMNCKREFGPVRLTIVASSREDLATKIGTALERLRKPKTTRIKDNGGIFYFSEPLGRDGKVAVLFPGEGAQYTNMLADICVHFPEVRQWFDFMDGAFEGHSRGYRPSDAVYPPPMNAKVDRLFAMDAGAEAVFTANQGLWELLKNLGCKPDAFVGHSTGEHTALLASETLKVEGREEMLRHVLGVNGVYEQMSKAGSISDGIMLAVAGADPVKLRKLLEERKGLYCALDNCPHQVVLCGEPADVEWLESQLSGSPAICQRLPMARAYHTPLFDEFSAKLAKHFDSIRTQAPQVQLYSCVSASPYPQQPKEIRALASVQWSRSVRFRETVEAMHADGVWLFIECGPRGNLSAFVDDILRGKPYAAIPMNVQHRTGITQLQHMAGMLIAHGVDLDLQRLYADRAPALYPPEAASKPKVARNLHIKTGLQPLRLPAEFKLASKPQAASATAATAGAPAPAAQATTAPSAPKPQTTRDSVLAQHFAGMQQFISSQQALMQTYLQSPRRKGTVRTATAGTAPEKAPTLPFITEVVELVPGERAVSRHRITLGRDRLFVHHTLGRQVSTSDPTLTGLPVVPLTVTMEILAEAGALLAPGQVLTGMHEVRSTRWIMLDKDLTLELTSRKGPQPGSVKVELRPAGAPQNGPSWAEGTMLFAPAYPAAPAPQPVQALSGSSRWADDRLYVDGMFHGPSFMAVTHMDSANKQGTIAKMTVLPRQELIAGVPQPMFLTDPVILDAAGQVVAFWSQETLLADGDIFPFRMVKLHCYQPPQAPGTVLECRVFVKLVTDREIESDIEIVDAQGRLHYRIEGWWDRRFHLPRCLWDARISAGKELIAKPWPASLSALAEGDVACSIVDTLSDELLDSSHGIWAEMLAHVALSRTELAQWEGMRSQATPSRRKDWLRGRCAAKDAVRMLVKQKTGVQLMAADVEIVADAAGKPTASGAWKQSLGLNPSVSLSHSGECAVAMAALSGTVGVDLETRGRAADGYQNIAFGPTERGLVEALATNIQADWFLRLWCAKESVAKALGKSMGEGLQALEVVRFDTVAGRVQVRLQDAWTKDFPDLKGKELLVRTAADGRFVFATVQIAS